MGEESESKTEDIYEEPEVLEGVYAEILNQFNPKTQKGFFDDRRDSD